MTTIQEDIDQCKRLEDEYVQVIRLMEDDRRANFGLIEEAQNKLARIRMKRLDIESKGLIH